MHLCIYASMYLCIYVPICIYVAANVAVYVYTYDDHLNPGTILGRDLASGSEHVPQGRIEATAALDEFRIGYSKGLKVGT